MCNANSSYLFSYVNMVKMNCLIQEKLWKSITTVKNTHSLSLCYQNDSFNKWIHRQPDIEKKVFIGELVINFIPKLCWLAVIVKMLFIKFISLIFELIVEDK